MNKESIYFDGLNLYVTFESHVKKWVQIFLISLNIIVYSGIAYGISQIPDDMIQTSVVIVFGFGAMIFFTLTWSTIWNVYGKEFLIINHKSVSHQKSYGLFITNLTTIKTELGIAIDFQNETSYTEEQLGTIWFYKYDDNYLTDFIYKTTIKTNIKAFESINEKLHEVYGNDAELQNIEDISLN